MTQKKIRPIPTDDDLVRIFSSQEFKDLVAENWPGNPKDKTRASPADVDEFAKLALGDARIYIHDAVKPKRATSGRPVQSPVIESTIDFTRNLQITYYTATGEQPSFTASRESIASSAKRGPFARILRWCLLELDAPCDDVRYINVLQSRSNTMNDEKGRPRRKRVRKNFKTRPE